MQLLKEGEQSEHNLFELRAKDEYYEFRALWKALANPGSVSILLTGPAASVTEEGLTTQKAVTRGKFGPQVEHISLLRFENHQMWPWLKTTTQVPKNKIPAVAKCAVRIMASESYRKVFLRNDDSPVQVIADIAAQTELQASQLTGGSWSQQKVGSRRQLVGHLRLNEKPEEKLVAMSAKQGMFTQSKGPEWDCTESFLGC